MRKLICIFGALLLITATSIYVYKQGTGICFRDYYDEVGLKPLQSAEVERFYRWMFNTPTHRRVFKNNGGLEGDQKFLFNFVAHVYVEENRSKQLNFLDYNTGFPAVNGVKTLGRMHTNFDYIDNALMPRALHRSVYIFWNALKDNAWNKEIEKNIQYLTAQNGEIDSFNLKSSCIIKRKRISYNPLYSFALISAHATPEEAAKCIFTTIMLNYGFSNASEIYATKDNVNCTEHMCTLNPALQPHSFLYTQIYDRPDGKPRQVVKGGESICQYKNARYKIEAYYCKVLREEFLAILPASESSEMKNRCKSLGIKMNMGEIL